MLETLQEGAVGLTFMIIAIISALVIYGWIYGFVQKMWIPPHQSSDIRVTPSDVLPVVFRVLSGPRRARRAIA